MTKIEAVQILFDTPPNRITWVDIQKAFTRKMKSVHPDLNPHLSQSISGFSIARLKEARDLLRSSPRINPMVHPRKPSTRPGAPVVPKSPSSINRELPQRTLRFGQYLYYRGIIDWQSLIETILAQRAVRPRFGSLAKELGFLDDTQLSTLKKFIKPGQFIGDTVQEIGLLSRDEVYQILEHQRRYYSPLGRVLVDRGLLSMKELSRYLWEFHSHQMVSTGLGRPKE